MPSLGSTGKVHHLTEALMPHITCTKPDCRGANPRNYVDLLDNYLDQSGRIKCKCGAKGFVKKYFELQEKGQTWDPYLVGAIRLASPEDTYQPFVFLCSSEPSGEPDETWFCYYKDTTHEGGRLKMGYGPGGPPVLGNETVVTLVREMLKRGLLDRESLQTALNNTVH